jgi:hypothetical protein
MAVKFLQAFALLNLLLLTSCSRPDAQLGQEIVGTWRHNSPGTPVVMTIGPDGSFSSKLRYPSFTMTWSGTWEISNGVFVTTATKSNDVPFHFVAHCRIVRLDSHDLACQIDYLSNGIITYNR